MTTKDKLFFVKFTIGCIVFIILVRFVFLNGLDKNSPFKKIISENTGIEETNVFYTNDVGSRLLAAFSGSDGEIGYAVLSDNMRGSYNCESYEFIYNGSRVINGTAEDDDYASSDVKLMSGRTQIDGNDYTIIVSNMENVVEAQITTTSQNEGYERNDSVDIRPQSFLAYENPDYENYSQVIVFCDENGNVIYEIRN